MSLRDVCKALNEDGAAVETLGSLHSAVSSELVGLMDDFLVDFEESLDVVRCESDRDQDEVFCPFLTRFLTVSLV